ncbi:HNH endonuclease [Glycomyces sambucus]|uniref:HNH endonuclease n=1 Tax=Glycomyces sambucus TaxID=380244 RepID=A0A1G9GT06_9ACTN|nr:HNH endonuclease signature motif containing protein [Glycomyces sambucus]SDL03742.1 HNH endonuclease [Glycomyces sambucus]
MATNPSDQAQAIRTTLESAADLINAQYAQVLSAVIAMKQANLHRTAFGYSALRDLLLSQFDFTYATAGSIAAIARLSTKFRTLAAAATSGRARIDQVAYAVRQLDKTPAMRLFARTPFREPVASPFDADTLCATPEHLIAEYCEHAPFKDLQRHLDELAAHLAEEDELLDGLGEQSLQWIELAEQGNGMWALSGELSWDTGLLLDKYLQTACPPPRQEEAESEPGETTGLLPAAPNRHAEALHQLLAGYGSSPEAAKRHGHTATLDLTVDIHALQGRHTGQADTSAEATGATSQQGPGTTRTPLLEGRPISIAKARLLACDTKVIPSVFDYESGEAIELGRTARLPNASLRRKLELEQRDGCAWNGCSRPVAWAEAHHIVHWADGGETNADNLILLCRFHHGRIHTMGWSVEKTGPGQAVITHHDHLLIEDGNAGQGGCGCADWRSDTDIDAENQGSDWDVFPTGLYRSEWSEGLKPDLDARAEAAERQRALAAIRAARAKCRDRFAPPQVPGKTAPPETAGKAAPPEAPGPAKSTARPVDPGDLGDPPFLGRPLRTGRGGGREGPQVQCLPARTPPGPGPPPRPGPEYRPAPPPTSPSLPQDLHPHNAEGRKTRPHTHPPSLPQDPHWCEAETWSATPKTHPPSPPQDLYPRSAESRSAASESPALRRFKTRTHATRRAEDVTPESTRRHRCPL